MLTGLIASCASCADLDLVLNTLTSGDKYSFPSSFSIYSLDDLINTSERLKECVL